MTGTQGLSQTVFGREKVHKRGRKGAITVFVKDKD
jgi:hypothetical protein